MSNRRPPQHDSGATEQQAGHPTPDPTFFIDSDGVVIPPAEPPDLTRPGAARAIWRLIDHLRAMDDDAEAEDEAR